MIIFISGGARSGKSHFSEETALSIYNKKNNKEKSLYYIATAKKSDVEMGQRIQIHQQERGNEWETIEEPFDLNSVLLQFKKGDVILVDCLTIWLSNVMFELGYSLQEIENHIDQLLTTADEKQLYLILVSNDLNEGLPHSSELVLTYMIALQQIHQRIIGRSDLVVQVQAGIPTFWKGDDVR
ncbi:bifunctional adenosylcobinamide kinase/adenosylcobinamide-phosphate guanylyltransferase [Litchfieldia salsa]|uniref:Adenosylcobinamide kinase n=1 Tax=Litchfieldia salsa TaxID=930152 RepID=A0A1H0URN4_9BACI|nr:bifunctional adenosylcobinamide kinase/adenosylcobinamide-phosphate guanylyltransferase [Litchfieldia salsa]SDP68775.1 adenosylcobinamide kinase /adenosylcobinamide-phosphate guanylyltransferase [Litchfieldia salsa]